MIYVKKNQDDTVQKVLSTFMKRVKKSNLVARSRKTQFFVKPASKLRRKQKALKRINYQNKKALEEKLSNI